MNYIYFSRCGCCGNALAGCAHVYIAGYDGTHSGFGDLLFMIQYMKSSLPLEIIEAGFCCSGDIPVCCKPEQLLYSADDTKHKGQVYDPMALAMKRDQNLLRSNNMYIVIAVIPVIIKYLLLSKFIIRGIALGIVKRQKPYRA